MRPLTFGKYRCSSSIAEGGKGQRRPGEVPIVRVPARTASYRPIRLTARLEPHCGADCPESSIVTNLIEDSQCGGHPGQERAARATGRFANHRESNGDAE